MTIDQKAFDGLHGPIVLICPVCKHRHSPRCKSPAEASVRDHLDRARAARWAKTTAQERSDHARRLVAAREAKRAAQSKGAA